jgi:SAM-dependent methyltransferase
MAVERFKREYSTVRRAEGWGSLDSSYYRALPYRDLSGRFGDIWRIRARSFGTFVRKVLVPLGRSRLTILDLGAGNGWLTYRLAQRGHAVIAFDLLDDPLDGLGAAHHYSSGLRAVLAEFDHLPLGAQVADLAIFNASFHYSTDYGVTLREILRVLRPHATLVILDSPMYNDPTSGTRMVQERSARFLGTYGFASNALPSEHFLTPTRLAALADELGLAWQVYRPTLDWRTRLTRTINGIRARREPASFPVIAGRRR